MFDGHRILILAPAQSGGIAAARAFRRPWMDDEARIAASMVARHARLLDGDEWLAEPPFRAPHHTVSMAGLVGGGTAPRPGEVSLAHGGVLVLDELEAFRLQALDALFRVLDDGEVRFQDGTVYPARPHAVVARIANPAALRLCVQLGNGWFAKG